MRTGKKIKFSYLFNTMEYSEFFRDKKKIIVQTLKAVYIVEDSREYLTLNFYCSGEKKNKNRTNIYALNRKQTSTIRYTKEKNIYFIQKGFFLNIYIPIAGNQTPDHTGPLSSFAKITYESHTIVRRHQSCFGEGQKI